MIDVKEIKKLYQAFETEGIDEVELQNGPVRVSFSIGPRKVKETVADKKVKVADSMNAQSDSVSEAVETASTVEAVEAEASMYELRSKWIGFFTRLNPKTGESYLKLRDMVKEGDIVGHVRVLGVLQDLKSEKSGKLKEVLIEEGQPIEYGQPVMRFEAAE